MTQLGANLFPEDEAGKKALHLHRLKAAGLPVPNGFVVLAEAALDPQQLAAEIEAIGGYPVAVRSSGVLEDLQGASFAGQYQTFLEVSGIDDLVKRIGACRDSAKSPQVMAYLDKHGLDPQRARVSVLVQRMVEPDVAGVGFSLHPLTGRDDHGLVELCRGLGERLVSGIVEPSGYVLELATGAIVDERIGSDGVTLTAQRARAMAALLVRVQAFFGSPQDIEWAIDHQGELHLLQARPITRVQWRRDLAGHTNNNMRDGGIASRVCWPMTFSLIASVVQPTLTGYLDGVHLPPPTGLQWMRWHYGRPYWNAAALKALMLRLPGFSERDFDEAMGLRPDYGPNGPRQTPATVGGVVKAVPTALSIKRWIRKHPATMVEHETWYRVAERTWRSRADQLTGLDDARLAHDLRDLVANFYRRNEAFYLTTGYINHTVQSDFRSLLADIDKATEGTTSYLALVGGLSDVGAGDIQRALAPLVTRARQAGTNNAEWDTALAQFLETAWFRSDAELDVTVPRWPEMRDTITRRVEAMAASGASVDGHESGAQRQVAAFAAERDAVVERVSRSLWLRLRYFRPFLDDLQRMREFLIRREQLREFSGRSYALLRRYLLEAGRRAVKAGRLDSATDVFALMIDELLDPTGRDLRQLASHRKALVEGYTHFDPPESFGSGTSASPPPAEGALRGLGCSPGRVEGVARVLRSVDELGALQKGDILVTPFTDPGWTPALMLVAGIVTEVGGVLSHAAVIGREYGIPTVLNVAGATRTLTSGQRVRIDGDAGTVEIL